MLGARLRTSGGWSLTGVTVMLNVSVTSLRGGARSNGAAEYMEEWGEESEGKAEEEGKEESPGGAAQARKVKLSLRVSESSWV